MIRMAVWYQSCIAVQTHIAGLNQFLLPMLPPLTGGLAHDLFEKPIKA
jgi:hypothetical protein